MLAPVTRERARRMLAIYLTVLPVSGVLDIDLEVLPDGYVAAVYQDGTLAVLTPQEFAGWLERTGQFTGQDLRLLATAPAGAAQRGRFAGSLDELARSAGTNIHWATGDLELRDGELTATDREQGWSAATFDEDSNPVSGWFASQDGRLAPVLGGSAAITLRGGYVSVSYGTHSRLRWWLQNRLLIDGVFDLALEAEAGGLHGAWTDGPGRRYQARDIAERLPRWGADDDLDIRLLVPDGARFEAEMSDLATLRGRNVRVTPMGAGLRVIYVSGAGGLLACDIIPVDRVTGQQVAWRVIGPRNAEVEPLPGGRGLRSAGQSWQDRFGPVIAGAALFPGQFVVGLEVGPQGRLSLYYGAGLYAEAGAGDLGTHLRGAGWRGETLLIVTGRSPADRVGEQARILADGLRADIYVLGVGAEFGVADGRLQARDAGGAAQDLWVAYESRPLRRRGYRVPSWFAQVNGVIVPRRGRALIRYPQGLASMGVTDYLARRALLEREPEPDPGLFDLLPQRSAHGGLGFADYQGGFVPLSDGAPLPALPAGTHGIRLIVIADDADDWARLRRLAAWLAAHYQVPVWVIPAGAAVVRAEGGRLIALSRESGLPVPLTQVMPDGSGRLRGDA